MGSQGIDRRQVLRGAGVAAGGLAVGLGLAQPADAAPVQASGKGTHGPSGSYLITRTENPSKANPAPTGIRAVFSFAAGGVLISLDIDPAAPPLLGSWESAGDRFEVVMWNGAAAAAPGAPATTVEVRPKGRISGKSISGTYTFTIRDAATAKVLAAGTGTFHGHKLEA